MVSGIEPSLSAPLIEVFRMTLLNCLEKKKERFVPLAPLIAPTIRITHHVISRTDVVDNKLKTFIVEPQNESQKPSTFCAITDTEKSIWGAITLQLFKHVEFTVFPVNHGLIVAPKAGIIGFKIYVVGTAGVLQGRKGLFEYVHLFHFLLHTGLPVSRIAILPV